jgi:hypothetical protein
VISDHSGYLLPSYATTCWFADNHLCLAIPSGPDSKAHVIRIPLVKCSIEKTDSGSILGRQQGWQAILEILTQRARTQEKPVRLGDRAAPVQYDIDAMLRASQSSSTRVKTFNGRGVEQLAYDDLFSEEQS